MGNYVKEVAIICLAVIEYQALTLGVDGALLAVVVAAIAGLGGYTVGRIVNRRKDALTGLERAGNER